MGKKIVTHKIELITMGKNSKHKIELITMGGKFREDPNMFL